MGRDQPWGKMPMAGQARGKDWEIGTHPHPVMLSLRELCVLAG